MMAPGLGLLVWLAAGLLVGLVFGAVAAGGRG